MNLEIAKHYIKRAINTFRYVDIGKKELVIDGYEVRYPEILIQYRTNNKKYTNRIVFRCCNRQEFEKLDDKSWDSLLANYAIIASVVFFKIKDFSVIHCSFTQLSDEAISFYEQALKNQLMEFRFFQGLNPNKYVKVTGNKKKTIKKATPRVLSEKALVLNGGGKDSIVSGEVIKGMDIDMAWFTSGLNEPQKAVIAESGIEDHYYIINPAIKIRPQAAA